MSSLNVDWDRICDFVFDTFGDDNAEMARYSLIEFGIDPDTRRPFFDEAGRCWVCGEGNGNHEEWCPNNDAAEQKMHPTLLESRRKMVTCPNCQTVFGVELPAPQSG